MESIVDLGVSLQGYRGYSKFSVRSSKREAVINFLSKKPVKIRVQKKDLEFITTINFKDNTIEREGEFVQWLTESFRGIDFRGYMDSLIQGFERNIENYVDSLSENECKELFHIYQLAQSNSTYRFVETLF